MSPDLIQALVGVLEAKDMSTAAHTWRVVLYTRALAEAHGVEPEVLQRLTHAAALHDVGKIDIPESILQKPGKLTDEEFAVMKQHTVLGYERLRRMDEDDPILLDLVRSHHERVDGKGYPDGLVGEDIPAAARYFSVIDTFDALTSIRPYRMEVGHDAGVKAVAELKAGSGTRYEPKSVQTFTELFESGALDWILSYFNDKSDLPKFDGLTDARSIAGKA